MALEFELKEEDDDDDDDDEGGEIFGLEEFMAAQSAKDVHERHLVFPQSIDNKISPAPFPILLSFFLFHVLGEVRFPIFTQNNTFWKLRFAISLSLSLPLPFYFFFFFSFFARRIRLVGNFCFGGEEFFHFLRFCGRGRRGRRG